MTPRRRRFLLAGAVVLATALSAASLLLHHYAQPEQVARLAKQFAREQLGLELAFSGTPRFAFWPHLRLELEQPSLSTADASVLSAQRVALALPWRSLRAEVLRVDELDLDAPQLDADALTRWLASSASSPVPAAQFGVRIREGTVQRGGKRLADGIALDGDFDLQAWDAWWRGLDAATRVEQLLPPGALKLSIAHIESGALRAEGITLESDAP